MVTRKWGVKSACGFCGVKTANVSERQLRVPTFIKCCVLLDRFLEQVPVQKQFFIIYMHSAASAIYFSPAHWLKTTAMHNIKHAGFSVFNTCAKYVKFITKWSIRLNIGLRDVTFTVCVCDQTVPQEIGPHVKAPVWFKQAAEGVWGAFVSLPPVLPAFLSVRLCFSLL